MKQLVQTIKFSEAKKILQLSQDRSLAAFVNKSGIRIVTDAKFNLSEILLDREDFKKALKVKELPEKFLTLREASDFLGITECRVKLLCAKGDLPFYRLYGKKGDKFLFIESELSGGDNDLRLDKAEMFYLKSWKYDLYEEFFKTAVRNLNYQDETNSLKILEDVLINDLPFEEISKNYGIPRDEVRKKINDGIENSGKIFQSIFDNSESNAKMNKQLLAEQAYFRQQIRDLNHELKHQVPDLETSPIPGDLFFASVVDLDLSVRAFKCLKEAEIYTFGELVNYNLEELTKYRNFGQKSLAEIREAVEFIKENFKKSM